MHDQDTAATYAMLLAGWKLLLVVEDHRDEIPDAVVQYADDFRATCEEWNIELPPRDLLTLEEALEDL
jgi:hypothetical protein